MAFIQTVLEFVVKLAQVGAANLHQSMYLKLFKYLIFFYIFKIKTFCYFSIFKSKFNTCNSISMFLAANILQNVPKNSLETGQIVIFTKHQPVLNNNHTKLEL